MKKALKGKHKQGDISLINKQDITYIDHKGTYEQRQTSRDKKS